MYSILYNLILRQLKSLLLPFKVNYETGHYSEVFENKDVVYLSSESENELNDLDDNTTYIIGGLIDYNHHKVRIRYPCSLLSTGYV